MSPSILSELFCESSDNSGVTEFMLAERQHSTQQFLWPCFMSGKASLTGLIMHEGRALSK